MKRAARVPSTLSRRKLLAAAVRGAAGVSLGAWSASPWRAFGQAAAARAADLGGGCHVLTLGATNVLAVAAADGVALVDGGAASQGPALLEALAGILPGDVHTLFNTHWHPDHTGLNRTLGEAGATIVAHENTRLWLTTDVTWPWNEQTVEPLPEIAQPNKTFYDEATLALGGQAVQCGYLRDCPHTDGDMYVFFPAANVMAVGDAVYGNGAGWPEIDWWTGGWIGGLVGGLDIMLTVANDDTRFVPGRGGLLTRADMLRQYEMYSRIWERLAQVLYGGGGPEEALAAEPTKEFNDIMGPPDQFVVRAFQSLWAYLSPDA